MSQESANVSYNPKGHSFSGWLGGKSQLAKTIIELMPDHHTYIEVFGGAGWVLFKKTPSKVEVLNDINGDLINLYRILKYHFDAFLSEFDLLLFSRDTFNNFKSINPKALTDIQRAARFYYIVRSAFGCEIEGNFSSNAKRSCALKLGESLKEHLVTVHQRLEKVTIENQGYDKLIGRMDGSDHLFYLDPPYFNCENYYGDMVWSQDDFYKLHDILKGIKGKFILSLNDLPETREIFKQFNFHTRKIRWGVSGKPDRPELGNELIICNF